MVLTVVATVRFTCVCGEFQNLVDRNWTCSYCGAGGADSVPVDYIWVTSRPTTYRPAVWKRRQQ